MSFHVYVEPELEGKLDSFCKKAGRKRNSVVREALREYIDRREARAWPDAVFDFKTDPNLTRFEALRHDLPPERDNIFGAE